MRWVVVAAAGVFCAVPGAARSEGEGLPPPELTLGGRILARVDGSRAEGFAREYSLPGARLSLEARWKGLLRAQIEADLAASRPLKDAWLRARLGRGFQLTAGRFKAPFSERRRVSSWDLPLVERGLVSEALASSALGGRQVGAQLGFRSRRPGLLAEVGAFNGAAGESESLAGRLVLSPWTWLRLGASAFRSGAAQGSFAAGPSLRLRLSGLTLDGEAMSLPALPGSARALGLTGLATFRFGLGRDFWIEPSLSGERLSRPGATASFGVSCAVNAGRGDALRLQLQWLHGQRLAGAPLEDRLMAQAGARF